MAKKILVLQHVAHEILGTLNPLFKQHGFRIRYVNFGRHPHAEPHIDGYQGIVVLGGPMNVDQVNEHPYLAYEIKLIEAALKEDIPILGICLGSQLLAKALGARVKKNPEKEIGWYPVSINPNGQKDPLLKNFHPTEQLFQWHGDTFEIPKSAVHLASSPLCQNQAFRYGKNVYGLQFHLEVDEAMIERWLKIPGNVKEMTTLKGKIDPVKIRHQTPKHISRLKELSDKTFSAFIGILGSPKKCHLLPSR